jgi:hypothetical protein
VEPGFGVAAAAIDGGDGSPFLWVSVSAAGEAANALDLFVEGPEGTDLPLPRRSGGEGGRVLFRVPLDGIDPDLLAGLPLVFTVVASGRAVEQHWRLTETASR